MRSLLPLLALFPGTALAGELGREYGGGEVVFFHRLSVSSDGARTETVEGDGSVRLRDGSFYVVGHDRLEDPDGNRYAVLGDAYQLSEEADVVYETRFVRYTPSRGTWAELRDSFLDANPTATADDVEALEDARAHAHEVPAWTGADVEEDLETWLAASEPDDSIDITVVLVDQPPLELPTVSPDLAVTDPVHYLEQLESRILALEDRKTDMADAQSGLSDLVTGLGGSVYRQYWLVNAFEATATPEIVASLRADSRVQRLELVRPDDLDTNQMGEIRDATQVDEYVSSGFDGERSSGKSTVGSIYVAVIDNRIDIDHPAFRDTSSTSSSRLVDAWQNIGGWTVDTTGMSSGSSHGTAVSSFILADLEDGQDSTYTTSAERIKRSGMAPEAEFAALDLFSTDASMVNSIEQAVALDVDIINMSATCSGCTICGTTHSRIDAVDDAMLANIFVVNSPDNGGNSGGCTVEIPGTASGSFTQGAYSRSASDLRTASISTSSPRGGDVHDRAMIDLVASQGRQPDGSTGYDSVYNNTYSDAGTGVSFSGPIIAGAAANYKDFLIYTFGSSMANTVGYIYSQMLLMGDGQLDPSGTATAMTPLDDVWGAGRLRMRKWDAAGMDSPWRMRYGNWELDDDEIVTFPLNPDGNGVNQALSADVEWFKAALWWHEPNLGSTETPATITFSVRDGTYTYTSSGSMPGSQRLWLGTVLNGGTWEIRINGVNVTASTATNYYQNQQKRRVYAALFWEDRDRDDGDGPPSDIE